MNITELFGLMSTPFDDELIRPASPGESGTVSGWCNTGLSGIGILLLRLADGERRYVPGDWRSIRDLAEAFVNSDVVVTESDDYEGCWFVSPVAE